MVYISWWPSLGAVEEGSCLRWQYCKSIEMFTWVLPLLFCELGYCSAFLGLSFLIWKRQQSWGWIASDIIPRMPHGRDKTTLHTFNLFLVVSGWFCIMVTFLFKTPKRSDASSMPHSRQMQQIFLAQSWPPGRSQPCPEWPARGESWTVGEQWCWCPPGEGSRRGTLHRLSWQEKWPCLASNFYFY